MVKVDRYAVMGSPITHSRSPEIHHHFATMTGETISYQAIEAHVDNFAAKVREFVRAGGRGLNVTAPCKVSALDLCDTLGTEASTAGSVNTLSFDAAGRCKGDTTDGIGFMRDLQHNLGYNLTGRRLLILGAGGAVRVLLGVLAQSAAASIVIANRTPERAEILVQGTACHTPLCSAPLDTLPEGPFDLIINGSAGNRPDTFKNVSHHILQPHSVCYDLNYSDHPTPFLLWGMAHGVTRVADGIGMLVEQAAESFLIWRGKRPDTATLLRRLHRVQMPPC